MANLCLGAANFGSRYGYNKTKIKSNDVKKILYFAFKKKIQNIDTSFEYPNSHKLLKNNLKKKFKINSKIIFKKQTNYNSIKSQILKFNKNSYSPIYSLMFHEQKDALDMRKIKIFENLKLKGFVKKIGISAYDILILKKILKKWKPDLIQFPVNPFNLEFCSTKFLSNLKRQKIKIFARSIFLQGFLSNRINSYELNKYKSYLSDWHNLCDEKSLNPVKACLDFSRSIKYLDFIIIGVNELNQLKQIVKFYKQKKKINFNFIKKKKFKKIDLRKINEK